MVIIWFKMRNYIENVVITILILLGLFIIYQIIKKVFGGSWTTDSIIISLLIFNLGCVFTIGLSLAKLKSDHNHLTNQFRSLANDFKRDIKK